MSAATPPSRPSEPAAPSAGRLWLFRLLAAVGIPAAFFLALEGGLRLAGWGRPVSFLIPDEAPGYYRTNPDFVNSVLPSSFDLRPLNFRVARNKPANTLRVVVLGESAAQGIPVPAFGFAAQLRAQLRARYPGREIEVINTGIVAINSHVVLRIARELAGFSPDLFVIYLGNNEVVGPYGPGCAYLSEMPPLGFIRLSLFAKSTRTGQLVAAALGRLARGGQPPEEWGGMAMFADSSVRGDDPRLEAVYRNFEANLTDILRASAGAGARTVLCTVASNLKDCAPLLSLHRKGLAGQALEQWERAFRRGRVEWLLGESGAARADLGQALSLDPQYADTAFLLGSLELEAGEVGAARAHFLAAEHWDALRFRPDPRINQIIRSVARGGGPGIRLVDAAQMLGCDPDSSAPPAGRELLFEHVHFDWEGNYALARQIAEGAEAALGGARPGARPWLDSAGCAAALAETAHERLEILQKVALIIQKPPFTNQLTYVDDEARLARDLARAQADRGNPAVLRTAWEVVGSAITRDPENADLAKIAEDIADDRGDLSGALEQARRAERLQPRNFALATDEAIKLSRLGRFAEAEQLLRRTAAGCPPRDRAAMAPAFADLFTRTRRFAEGRRYLDGEIAARPADAGLRLMRGRLARFAGDDPAAEREFRALLAANPGNQEALEELLQLLGRQGRADDAEKASRAAVLGQPRNSANDLRAAILADMDHDDPSLVRCLEAAERSGPVNSGVEVKLASKLFGQGRADDAWVHLAEARRLARAEGDAAATASIERVIARFRAAGR